MDTRPILLSTNPIITYPFNHMKKSKIIITGAALSLLALGMLLTPQKENSTYQKQPSKQQANHSN
jgi:hypothetical protein